MPYLHYLLITLSLLPFYFIGVFPSGYLIAKQAGVDIAKHGSGNVGATNISRVLGKKAGLLTLLIDISKGALAVGLGRIFVAELEWYVALTALAVVLGHCISLPPYLKGGKGVATSLGAMIVVSPALAFLAVLVFAGVFAAKHIVSLASVSAAISTPLFAMALGYSDELLYGLIPIALVIVIRHKDNLKRLALGTEPRTEFKKNAPTSSPAPAPKG